MCGRFFRHGVTWAEYHDALALVAPDGVSPPEPTYNAAPTTVQPVIRRAEHADRVEMAPARWGLIPSWWSRPLSEMKFSTFNAQAETAGEKPVFRGAYRHKRCLVPVSGFYEWTGAKGAKIPFAIGLRNRRWFCLAGLWDSALIDGSEIQSFTILTTRPNDLMAGLHTRMPVIVDPADYALWLDPDAGDPARLFEPFPTDAMHAWPVGPAVGNVRNNSPELIAEV
ncbi:SOS response-associated peptidase [Hyphomonas sp.]|uniref:SOS response-associated peptidase n=1 Tax=Hyphomonas sp. TaxID=87 RepID=UPI003D2BA238|tara:strand:+ start:21863 stop:22537 length:675 start_codon:yes stop_codon:yes gene_type:complete